MSSQAIVEFFRKPMAKVLERAILYGLTTWLGVEASQAASTAEQAGYGLAALITFVAAILIDRLHHRADTAVEKE